MEMVREIHDGKMQMLCEKYAAKMGNLVLIGQLLKKKMAKE